VDEGGRLMQHDAACDRLPGLAGAYAHLVRRAEPSTPVPTCPGWTLRKLTRHLGTTYRWAGAMVGAAAAERVDPRTLDLDLPGDDAGLADWLERSAAELVAIFRGAAPDAPMWAWGADRHVRFWPRRMVHETVVHAADASIATGADPVLDPALATDAIDELLENLPTATSFAPRVVNLRGQGETIALLGDGTDAAWSVTLVEAGFVWRRAAGPADVTVHGAAGDLELLLYGRRRRTDAAYRCVGDLSVLDRWLANSSL
jgi:uncharacterized protein (TIGR03083 family)